MAVHHRVREREPVVADSSQEVTESDRDLHPGHPDHKGSLVESQGPPARKSYAS